jgi:hypothetical protein
MRPLQQLAEMMQLPRGQELDVHIVGMTPTQIKTVLGMLLEDDYDTRTATHLVLDQRTHGGMTGHPTLVLTHKSRATLGDVTLEQMFAGLEFASEAYTSKLRHFIASNIDRGTRMRLGSPVVPLAWRIFAYADDRDATGVQSAWKRASAIIIPSLNRHFISLALEDAAQLPVKLFTLEDAFVRPPTFDTLLNNRMLFEATAHSVMGAAVAGCEGVEARWRAPVTGVHDALTASVEFSVAAFNRDVVEPAVAQLAAAFSARAHAEAVPLADRPITWLLRDFTSQAAARIDSLRALLDADMPLDPGLCARNNEARYVTEMGKAMTQLVQSFMSRIVTVTIARALNEEAQPYMDGGASLAAADLLALRLQGALDFDARELDVGTNWPMASHKHVLDSMDAPQLATSFVQCVLQPWMREMRERLAGSPDYRRVLDLLRAASLDGQHPHVQATADGSA